ncbi:MAG: hypothetical protein ACRCXL_06280 [Dermatophilaceae bacterium]
MSVREHEVPPQPDAMGATVTAYLITGPVCGGALGYAIDVLADIRFFIVVGLLAGMALSVYTIWLRYGRTESGVPTPPRPLDDNPSHEETL